MVQPSAAVRIDRADDEARLPVPGSDDAKAWLAAIEQRYQAQQTDALSRLAGGIAHDFNNLLTVISGYAEVLWTRLRPDDPARELVAEIRKAGDRAAALTLQLRLCSGKQVATPIVLDLNAAVTGLETSLRAAAGEAVQLVTDLQPDLGQIRADPGLVEELLLNLAGNGRDTMPQGGTLTVTTRDVELDPGDARTGAALRPGRYVVLTVADTGRGMEAEVLARVCEPYFLIKRLGRGGGLGLAVVHGIVRQSGGHIEVDSAPGQGTRFTVYLPRVGEALSCNRIRKNSDLVL